MLDLHMTRTFVIMTKVLVIVKKKMPSGVYERGGKV